MCQVVVPCAVLAGVVSGYRLVMRGALTLDLGARRHVRPLGPPVRAIAAPREVVFDVVARLDQTSLAGDTADRGRRHPVPCPSATAVLGRATSLNARTLAGPTSRCEAAAADLIRDDGRQVGDGTLPTGYPGDETARGNAAGADRHR
jgi:hypothetical protein